ncbi:methyltransferase domain-containing protein [candidate division TA06 bacterium]|uniref:Methyltransferase domain-containing protein n=1 Tax=candidate division TA06 bacterium TaxID=2250710 RepID=A0A523XJU1_UNCT6|nr:MAG: methyltransferase domain-containing protein [candidate division TA06 bacterium]
MKCPVCDATRSINIGTSKNYRIHKCLECKLEYAEPMRLEDATYYQSRKFYQLKRILAEKKILPSLRTKWEFGQFLKYSPNRGGKLLDIGCGEGQFLYYARKLGYDVYGVDMDELSVDVAKKYFHLDNIYAGDFDSFYEKGGKRQFECITFFELLEHVEDPKRFLSRVRQLLKPGGYIALSAPNAERITVRLHLREKYDYPPHHLTRWGPESLRGFIEREGFEIVKHEFTPQILRYIVAGLSPWWGGKDKNASRFLEALSAGKKPALWIMRSYLGFLDILLYAEIILTSLLRAINISGISHFVIARKTAS